MSVIVPQVPSSVSLLERALAHAHDWRVEIETTRETPTSLLVFGTRRGQPVVLKAARPQSDEWRAGPVLAAFGGRGIVGVLAQAEGVVLLERLTPGTPLASLTRAGRDPEAAAVLAALVHTMAQAPASFTGAPTLLDWAVSFDRYLAGPDPQLDRDLTERAWHWFLALARTQTAPRLLHGDLQHYNILQDNDRGWVAIDPKGVVGESEYELAASLRNPTEAAAEVITPPVIEKRLRIYSDRLGVEPERILGWGFAQGVLSAIWEVEDRIPVSPRNAGLTLARVLEPMLPPLP